MQGEAGVPAKKPLPIKLLLNLVLLAGVVGIFGWQIHKALPDIQKYARDWHPDWLLASLALVVLLLCSWIDILIWNRTLGWFTDRLPFRKAAPVYIWSYLARYVPGKVFSLLLRVALAREVDRSTVPVLASSTVELAPRTASALILGFLALLSWKGNTDNQVLFYVAGITVILAVLIGAHPKVMLPITNFGLKKMKKPPITRPLRYREVLGTFAALFLRWTLFGIAFWLIAASVFPRAHDLHDGLILVATGPGSWAIGFLSMLPGGLGSMELVQKEVMAGAFGIQATNTAAMAPVFIIILFFRLWTLAAEALWSLAGLVLRRRWGTASMPIPAPATPQVE